MNNEQVRKILTDRNVTPRAPMHPNATYTASDFLRGVVVGSIGTVISTLLLKVLL